MNLPTYIMGTIQVKAYRVLRQRTYEVLSQHDLTPTYWSMLGIIIEARDGIRQVEVARTLHVKAPLITAMARQLQERGFIRSVPNQFDARAKLLAITPVGRKFVKTVELDLSKALEPLLAGLTEKDMKTYHRVLTAIIANASASEESSPSV